MTNRTEFERLVQQMSDDYDRAQAEHAAHRGRPSWPLIAALVVAILAVTCRAFVGMTAP